jgi:tRNA nucleotidyltransferase (CCA-adding enzyme)
VQRLFRRVSPTASARPVTVLTKNDKVESPPPGRGAYAKAAAPDSVVFLDDVKDDPPRRDFTINAMAFDPIDQEFVDPFGGARDLEARLVRCVGRARDRFGEDGLRPLRAVRFASVLGFDIDAETCAAIPATLSTFGKIALERVREELSKMLVGPQPSRGVRLLRETGLLAAVLPEAAEGDFERTLARADACPPRLEVRHAALLFAQSPERAGRRWSACATRAAVERTATLVRHGSFAPVLHTDDASFAGRFARSGAVVEDVLALGRARGPASKDARILPACEATARRTRSVLEAPARRTPSASSPWTARGHGHPGSGAGAAGRRGAALPPFGGPRGPLRHVPRTPGGPVGGSGAPGLRGRQTCQVESIPDLPTAYPTLGGARVSFRPGYALCRVPVAFRVVGRFRIVTGTCGRAPAPARGEAHSRRSERAGSPACGSLCREADQGSPTGQKNSGFEVQPTVAAARHKWSVCGRFP